jgi:23S rRNA (uridine2552-2'-O)-methyltransferase
VVGVDLVATEPLPNENVVSFQGDLAEPAVLGAILEALGGPADVLLSDAAPKLTGVRATDRAREEALLEAIEAVVPRLLRPGGSLVMKLLESPEARAVATRLAGRFGSARITGLRTTRERSSEKYLIARDFSS